MTEPVRFAVVYDFDGTLAPGNMQERDFIPAIGMTGREFWDEVERECQQHQADSILMYMMLMLRKAEKAGVAVGEDDFRAFGRKLAFFPGLVADPGADPPAPGWFDRINAHGRQHGLAVEHYVISSGMREFIEGTAVADQFRAVFASSFCYDAEGNATWPALALNYTSKTQYLFRINKGCLDVYRHELINRVVPRHERPVPFSRMVYLGDGETDVPCLRLTRDQGGHSVAVWDPDTSNGQTRSQQLVTDGRAHFAAPADYRPGRRLDHIVKAVIDKAAADHHVRRLY